MNRRNFGSLKAWALMGASAAAIASPAWAQEARRFEIPSQSLVAALEAFGKQGQAEILFNRAAAEGRSGAAVSGEYAPSEALALMLSGSGLKFRQVNGNTFIVEAAPDPQSASAAGDGAEVEALIVTAQKREEDIQDVPIAISAFTQEALERSQVAGGPDLMTQVPNMTFTKTNFSSYSIQIRGIGTQAISATVDPAVAVAFNNTSFIRNRFFEQEFYDLSRVEVLRGPQGTLYGRNATAGVVNILSARPSFGYEARLSADLANYNSTRLEGMLNLPLVEDAVALRVAGAWTKREGYSTNELTGDQIDGRDLWSTRVSLRIAPTDNIEANLIWEHFEEDDDRLRSGKQLCHTDDRTEYQGYQIPPIGFYYSQLFSQGCLAASLYSPDSFEAPNGFAMPYYHPLGGVFLPTVSGFNPYARIIQSADLRAVESMLDPEYRAETDVIQLQARFDLGSDLTITSETAYLSDDVFSTQDYNRFATQEGAFNQTAWDSLIDFVGGSFYRENLLNDGVFCDPQLGCANRVVAQDLSTARSTQFSQEFRVSSDFAGPFNFSMGANFLRYDTEDKYYVFINTLSMFSAISPGGWSLPEYVPGVTDNHECLPKGLGLPDPTQPQELQGCVYMDPNPIGQLNDLGHNYFLSKNPYKLMSYAVFGEAYYDLTETLKVTAGVRWTTDRKEAPRIPSWVLGNDAAGYPVLEVVEQEWTEPTGRLTLDWKPDLEFTDDSLFYASYAHGYKAGGSNPPPTGLVYRGATAVLSTDAGKLVAKARENSATKPKTFEPEFVDAFELGTKNTLFDGRVTLNANVFYYDYQGYQISQIIDRSAVNYNFDAKIWGIEVEADWRPLENLRLGFKGGFEDTRVADGAKAIDIMDRTAGKEGWIVVRPFPSFASNCVLPTFVLAGEDGMLTSGGGNAFYNGNPGPCEYAYLIGLDPATLEPYVPDPESMWPLPPDYPGWNPFVDQGHNFGEGFFKDLSGKELPNAPDFTATVTADYTIPLPNDWLATLHTDLYYQSEAWTRIFNTEGYDKLKAYTNVNLAAIFTNEDAGWKVMAYVKNVFDRDSITGAFLNSDDTGLTTNVFLTEPRLYGLRVTKEWNGGPWFGAGDGRHAGPYPLTIELGGMVQRHDAPYAAMASEPLSRFSEHLDPRGAQNQDLDWGDGREVSLIYEPAGLGWRGAVSARIGRTNGVNKANGSEQSDGGCLAPEIFAFVCAPDYNNGQPPIKYATNYVDGAVINREDHTIIDFAIGRDVGVGLLGEGSRSVFSAGLRYATLNSRTRVDMVGIPTWSLPDFDVLKYPDTTHERHDIDVTSTREFTGVGPILSWEGAKALLGSEETGQVLLDWTLAGGVLFGKQDTAIAGHETLEQFSAKYLAKPRTPDTVDPNPVNLRRRSGANTPVIDLSLGLSFEVGRFNVGAGYRWERYFDAIDGGYLEEKQYDRTIDGPYFKLAVGFGG